ncbi:alkaline phosphatase family protein [Xylella taiwanensis]|uniref:Ectonucleotide pyrophosphatase/phosphodiesterase n=1 Tax=Xylella taiwanensis TaxID=1444770 RepID=Z9JH30_9GAMM|nr:ectonucleotide pyrophosphatase/phosphodiesterase [Xylella taiwanensis]AXI84290.1 phosphodiesterase [Xylella taiwanensis]EWS77720.1 phosphodiesterase-nucleotide pyrophosphatase [Xylella taiwanensis]MCD8457405.1 ectonucleotide pyrophosphatase/phosphodiesterase [Xylella taiwanensis]MCD8457563.1 ectonucleotide pyrophosphatase/phosphodiesterase [Xylella taiwanensis]MCD8462653.1 ectonucleotide pyrophosphatase/phosphodiesterase [Xylella taiwanensis]
MMIARLLSILISTLLLAACSIPIRRNMPIVAITATPQHKLLLISIDGLRADALEHGQAPQLARLAADGVRARWMTPSYPALTFPNHYTLVTGLRPDHHGIVHNTMEDPLLGTFEPERHEAISDGRWWGGEPIWVSAEHAGIRSATFFWPGSEASIAGTRPSRWHVYNKRIPLDTRVNQVLRWFNERGPDAPRLVILHFEQVDTAGQGFGPDSPQYAAAVHTIDTVIGRLIDSLRHHGRLADTDVIVVSDHGIAPVPGDHAVPLERIVRVSDVHVVSDGQVLGITPLPGHESQIEAMLLGAHATYDCWRKQAVPAHWHYGTHPRIPTILCQMHEGWDALPAAQIIKRNPLQMRGSSGFDPTLPSMHAVFLAHGPSFIPGTLLNPISNVDVYPLLARLLGIPAAPNDGDPRALLPALRSDNAATGYTYSKRDAQH